MDRPRARRHDGLLHALLRADDAPPQRPMTLHRETIVAAPLDATFAFFADAANLEQLTPAWLNFTIRTSSPVVMRPGLEIEYRIRLYGVGIPWRSLIEVWEPGARFVDLQIIGPYRWWRHEHVFETGAEGTKVIDHVEYQPRGAWLTRGLVRRDLERIFTYRQQTLRRLFPPGR